MLKQKYFLTNFFILSAEKQPIKSSWRNIEWLQEYQSTKQKQLPDYPIFMAIAEQIGYDATGKKIAVNELDIIGEELKNFIETL